MRFFNGDIVKFEYRDKPKKSWLYKRLIKTDDKYYICSYIGQGEIKHQYELKNGDLFIVRMYILGHIGMESLSANIPNDLYYTHISSETQDIFTVLSDCEANKILRKEKLKKLSNI